MSGITDPDKVVWVDGRTYIYHIDLPLTRTFVNTLTPNTCTDSTATLEIFDHNGDKVTSSTSPWSLHDLTTHMEIRFSSADSYYKGTYLWGSIGLTWYVIGEDDPVPTFERETSSFL